MEGPLTSLGSHADRAGFLVRVLTTDRHRPVGIGFLVTGSHLMTCAHVVNVALGRSARGQDQPAADIRVPVDFPILGDVDGAPVRLCRVVRWLPPPGSGTVGDDVAGLALVGEGVPHRAGPARLLEGAELNDRRIEVFGQPASRRSGAWAPARVRGLVGDAMLQIDSDPSGAMRLQPGYSGSPLVTTGPDGDAVVGMLAVASAQAETRDAYGVPIDRLVRAWPDVLAGIPPCPYPGLRPFGPADEQLFVGRESDTEAILASVRRDPLTVVVGPSGIGKSSLVNAGVIPRWKAAGNLAVTVRPGPPGASPLRDVVAEVVAGLRASTGGDAWSVDVEDVPGGFVDTLSRRADTLGTGLLVHLDQFEELLGSLTREQAQSVVDVLLPETRDPATGCRVVITVRADHLPLLLELPGLDTRLRNRLHPLAPMGVAELERAVAEPAQARGVAYEPGLAALIAQDASGGPGSTPLMAFALTRLWGTQHARRIGFADYHLSGGVTGAIDQYAEQIYADLAAAGSGALAKAVLMALVRSRGGAAEAVSRAVPRSRFDAPVVAELSRARLLTVGTGAGEPTLRLAHDSLVGAWRRLARWVDDDAEFQRWLAMMEDRAVEDDLLDESRLAVAERWLGEREADVPADVVALVDRSRSTWRARVAELEGAKADAEAAASRAERAASEAEARRLAAASELLTATAPGGPLPIALATASVRTRWTVEGDVALRHALRTAPHPIATIPNPRDERFVDVSVAGTLLVRSAGDTFESVRRSTCEVHRLDLVEGSSRVAYASPGSGRAVAGGWAVLRPDPGRVLVVDAEGAIRYDDHHRRPVLVAEVSEDGARLVIVRGRGGEDSLRPGRFTVVVTVVTLPDGVVRHRRRITAGGEASFRVTGAGGALVLRTANYDKTERHKWMARSTVYDVLRDAPPVSVEHDGDPGGYPTARVVVDPGRRLLIAGSNDVDSCGDAHRGRVEVFDLTDGGRLLHSTEHYLPIQDVALDPAGDRLAVAIGDVRVVQTPGFGILTDTTTGRERHRFHHDHPVDRAGFASDGTVVWFAGARSVRVFASRRGDELARYHHEHQLQDVSLDAGREPLTVTRSQVGIVQVFQGRPLVTARHDWPSDGLLWGYGTDPACTLAVASFSGSPAAGRDDGFTEIIDVATGITRRTMAHPRFARVHAVSADGSRAALELEGALLVEDLEGSSPPIVVDHGGTHHLDFVWFTPDESHLVTAAAFNVRGQYHTRLRRTDLATQTTLWTVDIPELCVAISADGSLAAYTPDREREARERPSGEAIALTVAVVEVDGMRERFRYHTTGGDTTCFGPTADWLAYLADHRVVLVRTLDGSTLWSCAFGRPDEFGNPSFQVLTDPTGTYLAVVEDRFGGRGTITVLAVDDGSRVLGVDCATGPASARFSLDGQRIVMVIDGVARVVDLACGDELCVVEHEVRPVTDASFVGSTGERLLTRDQGGFRVSPVNTNALLATAYARAPRDLTDAERRRYLRASSEPPGPDPDPNTPDAADPTEP